MRLPGLLLHRSSVYTRDFSYFSGIFASTVNTCPIPYRLPAKFTEHETSATFCRFRRHATRAAAIRPRLLIVMPSAAAPLKSRHRAQLAAAHQAAIHADAGRAMTAPLMLISHNSHADHFCSRRASIPRLALMISISRDSAGAGPSHHAALRYHGLPPMCWRMSDYLAEHDAQSGRLLRLAPLSLLRRRAIFISSARFAIISAAVSMPRFNAMPARFSRRLHACAPALSPRCGVS